MQKLNPIVVGIAFTGLTYASLYYNERERQKKFPKSKKKKTNVIIPLIVGTIVWFLADCYLETLGSNNSISPSELKQALSEALSDKQIPKLVTNANALSDASDNLSYHYIKKGELVMPDLDVFLDIGKF